MDKTLKPSEVPLGPQPGPSPADQVPDHVKQQMREAMAARQQGAPPPGQIQVTDARLIGVHNNLNMLKGKVLDLFDQIGALNSQIDMTQQLLQKIAVESHEQAMAQAEADKATAQDVPVGADPKLVSPQILEDAPEV